VQAVESSLRAHGLDPGPVSANSLSIPVDATAGQLSQAFSTSFSRVALPNGASAIANQRAPSLDPGIAPGVQAVLGLDTLSSVKPLLVRPHAAAALSPQAKPHVVTGGPQPCAAASQAGAIQGGYTADQIASAYGVSGLYQSGGPGGQPDEGAGQTVAILELEPYDANDIIAFEQCYGVNALFANVSVDGGAGSGPGSGEAALDIENVIGLAPKANIAVYEGPNSGTGPYDTFSMIISQHAAQVVSASWGQCEPLEGFSQAAAENTLFQEAAAQGMSIVSASGDDGSEDCYPFPPTLQVDDPASQPFVTGVGGTSLTALGPRPTESVWNDGAGIGAGGGGISTFWSMPAYQSGAPSFLHVINSNSSGSNCAASSGDCREVPDVSADGDPAGAEGLAGRRWHEWRGADVGGTDRAGQRVEHVQRQGDRVREPRPLRVRRGRLRGRFQRCHLGRQRHDGPQQRHLPGGVYIRHGERARHAERFGARRLALHRRDRAEQPRSAALDREERGDFADQGPDVQGFGIAGGSHAQRLERQDHRPPAEDRNVHGEDHRSRRDGHDR
jgi:hypothetical protein